jgi:putative NIF3 family GTP cyclohydrolase 1 type 2
MTASLFDVRAYLDDLLRPTSSDDREGNGLVVEGPEQVRRIGAALNTSFWAIESAAAAQADLLLVHHAPWSEIDLHLRGQKLSRLAAARIGLYAAHDTLDRAHPLGIGRQFAELVEVDIENDGDLIVGTARNA